MTDLTQLSATELLEGYGQATFDPTDVVEACFAQIDQTDDTLHAVVARCDDSARAAARHAAKQWQSGVPRSLEGVPLGVKDIIETAGVRTAAGSPLFADHVPEKDATVVERLQSAGAIMVAKTTTPEFAFGDDARPGAVNPWDPERWTGGSSSGSAVALASHQMPIGLGTDTGGSVRVPSSYCGVCGLKPTFGLVPRDGVFPVSWTLDHVGPMARSVEDLARMLAVMAGASQSDPYTAEAPIPDYVAELNSFEAWPEGWRPRGMAR